MQNNLGKIGAKILIVDDDVNTTQLIENILSKEGYESISTNDSTHALSIAISSHPDLILLDLMMPDIDGIGLCKVFQSNQSLSSVPIIVFTAMGNIENKVAAFNAGAKDYITKPIHIEEFKLRIKMWLESSNRLAYKYELTH
jgi:DNA-binding response OmpR family regulator